MNIRKKRVPIQGTTNTANAATTTTMTTMTNFKKTQNNFYTQAVNKNSRSCILIQNQSSKSKSNGRDWYGQTSHGYSRNAYKNAYANTVINENKNMHNNDQLLALQTKKNSISIQKQQNKKLINLDTQKNPSLKNIRTAYKNKPSIWRIAKSWNLTKKGYITQQQLQNNLQHVLGINITKQQVEQIVKIYGNEAGRIDTKNFVKMIYGEAKDYGQVLCESFNFKIGNINKENVDNQYNYNPRLYDLGKNQKQNCGLDQKTKVRNQKINNLIDNLECYQDVLGKRFKLNNQFLNNDNNNDNGNDSMNGNSSNLGSLGTSSQANASHASPNRFKLIADIKKKQYTLTQKLNIEHFKAKTDTSTNQQLKHENSHPNPLPHTHTHKHTHKHKKLKSQSHLNVQFNKQEFFRITQSSFLKSIVKNKQRHMHPETMYNQNQCKTRFGPTHPHNLVSHTHKTPHTIATAISQTNSSSTKIDKQPIHNHNYAQKQKELNKQKLQARYQKIREMYRTQKQNIDKYQEKCMNATNARILRKKLDREAYEYSAFVRNQWR